MCVSKTLSWDVQAQFERRSPESCCNKDILLITGLSGGMWLCLLASKTYALEAISSISKMHRQIAVAYGWLGAAQWIFAALFDCQPHYEWFYVRRDILCSSESLHKNLMSPIDVPDGGFKCKQLCKTSDYVICTLDCKCPSSATYIFADLDIHFLKNWFIATADYWVLQPCYRV